jgi:hypothetical protein
MNTTAAATQAGVTIATIRTWCRRGVIAATKPAGRWIIDTTSLTRRIEIGARMSTPTTRYTITEGTNQYGTTTWTVTRTDGTEAGWGPGKDSRIRDMVFIKKDQAEIAAGILEQLPEEYHFAKREVRYHSSSINSNHWVWEVTGGTSNDPKELKADIRVDTPASVEEVIAHLMMNVHAHAQGAEERIAKKAEQDAIAAAEATVREAREEQLTDARRQKGPLATPRQVDYILQLLARREHTGEGGGFFYGPTDRAGIEEMSKADASTYITSLKGDY